MALVRFLTGDDAHGRHNRAVIDGWLATGSAAAAREAAAAVSDAAGQVDGYARRTVEEALSAPAATDDAAAAPRAAPVAGLTPRTRATRPGDHVGIVMAKSAEGDAVARFFAGRAEVIEQPAFWEIRAAHRLVIPYDEVSEELGYEIDAYSIQHEMSTHYGRMVATDDALMLFADPTEAMAAPPVMKRRLARWLARRDRGRVAHRLILAALPRAIARRFDAARGRRPRRDAGAGHPPRVAPGQLRAGDRGGALHGAARGPGAGPRAGTHRRR